MRRWQASSQLRSVLTTPVRPVNDDIGLLPAPKCATATRPRKPGPDHSAGPASRAPEQRARIVTIANERGALHVAAGRRGEHEIWDVSVRMTQ